MRKDVLRGGPCCVCVPLRTGFLFSVSLMDAASRAGLNLPATEGSTALMGCIAVILIMWRCSARVIV